MIINTATKSAFSSSVLVSASLLWHAWQWQAVNHICIFIRCCLNVWQYQATRHQTSCIVVQQGLIVGHCLKLAVSTGWCDICDRLSIGQRMSALMVNGRCFHCYLGQ